MSDNSTSDALADLYQKLGSAPNEAFDALGLNYKHMDALIAAQRVVDARTPSPEGGEVDEAFVRFCTANAHRHPQKDIKLREAFDAGVQAALASRTPSPEGGEGLDATFDKMLNERLERQRHLQSQDINTSFNEGWIDALEHVLGIIRLRASRPPAVDVTTEQDALKPCPFCGAQMRVRARSAFHPENDCWLATAGEHGVYELDELDYPGWNRRTPSPEGGEVDAMRRALKSSHENFRELEQKYRRKAADAVTVNPDRVGDEGRARTYKVLAEMCERALASRPPAVDARMGEVIEAAARIADEMALNRDRVDCITSEDRPGARKAEATPMTKKKPRARTMNDLIVALSKIHNREWPDLDHKKAARHAREMWDIANKALLALPLEIVLAAIDPKRRTGK